MAAKSPAAVAKARSDNNYKVVCYFSSWAWLRRGDGQFVPENVIPATCTHVLYAYAGLDPVKLVIKSNDIWTDLSNSNTIPPPSYSSVRNLPP